MKKKLLFILLLFSGIIVNAQSLGMSAIEVRQEIEGKGYEVETLTTKEGIRVLYTLIKEDYIIYYLDKNNTVFKILYTVNGLDEISCKRAIVNSGFILVKNNTYEKNNMKLELEYSETFNCWVTIITFK